MPPRIDWESQVGRRLRLRDLHVFSTVARMGSMGKAAQELRVSQPAVSEVIADLEHAVGARLLDRTPQGISVTPYGAALERRVLTVFDELKQGIKDIEFLLDPTAGEVRIGCPESISAAYIDPDGVIQEIHHFEKQDTNPVVASTDNIQYVLEVSDGWFPRHNVNTGVVVRTERGTLAETFKRQ